MLELLPLASEPLSREFVYALSLDLSPLAVHPLPNSSHVALEGAEGIGGAMAFEVVPTIAARLHSNHYTKIIIRNHSRHRESSLALALV